MRKYFKMDEKRREESKRERINRNAREEKGNNNVFSAKVLEVALTRLIV